MLQQREQLLTTLVPAKYELLSAVETKRWKTIWKQRLIIGVLVLSDILLALLVWGVAYALHSVWGQGALSGPAIAMVVPTVAAWIGLRASLGMYRGYGLDRVEDLRRSTYAVFATLAIVAIFAVSLQFGELLSRPLLTAGFAGLLLLAPLTRHFVERGLNMIGVWGKPVVILGAGGMGSMESGAYTANSYSAIGSWGTNLWLSVIIVKHQWRDRRGRSVARGAPSSSNRSRSMRRRWLGGKERIPLLSPCLTPATSRWQRSLAGQASPSERFSSYPT